MSNRPRPSDPDNPATIDEAFAAKLASATPRLGIDATALHYEAGYRAAVDGFHRERTLYRGVACGSAAVVVLSLGLWIWQGIRIDGAGTRDVDNVVATNDGAQTPEVVPPNVATDHEPEVDATAPAIVAAETPDESTAPRSSAAFAELDRRYLGLTGADEGRALRWTDLYDLASERATWTSTPAPSSPDVDSGSSSSYRPAPWSVRPGEFRMNHLLREGI